MTLYLELPGSGGKLDRLLGEFGAVALPGPPGGLDEVPPDRALICVVDMGDYEAPGYIITEIELAAWADPADTRPRTWLLMDRWMADRLCPGAAEDRESWQLGVERDAEAAAHTDNLVPVARASRSGLRRGPIRDAVLSWPQPGQVPATASAVVRHRWHRYPSGNEAAGYPWCPHRAQVRFFAGWVTARDAAWRGPGAARSGRSRRPCRRRRRRGGPGRSRRGSRSAAPG